MSVFRFLGFGRKSGTHDLLKIYKSVNDYYFGGTIRIRNIGWSRSRQGINRKTIVLGTFWESRREIKIHPALDQYFVPSFFISYIIYHEMLHSLHRMYVRRGRLVIHSDRFRADERLFEEYDRAVSWQEKNIHRLLSY